jgi:hypothetical protein
VHISFMGETRKHKKFWSENLKGRENSEGLGVVGKILDWILGNGGGSCGLAPSGSG